MTAVDAQTEEKWPDDVAVPLWTPPPPLTPEQELAYAFPDMEPGAAPAGSRVLVQIKRAKDRVGSILLSEYSREADQDNMQVGRIVAVGPLAFKNRETQKEWPEGAWAPVGAFIRIIKHGGDRFGLAAPDGGPMVQFAIVNDLDIMAVITGDPLSFKAFV